MKRIFPVSIRIIIPLLTGLCVASADPVEPAQSLAKGLMAEEVARDLDAAAGEYMQVLDAFRNQQAVAASALFRLAEVRRKQDRKADAIALYQRLVAEFPAATTEVRIARENLAALGSTVPAIPAGTSPDPEEQELARLRDLFRTSPDLVKKPEVYDDAVRSKFPRVVRYLKEIGVSIAGSGALTSAVEEGNLEMVKLLLAEFGDQCAADYPEAMHDAIISDYVEISRVLLAAGDGPSLNQQKILNKGTHVLMNGTLFAQALYQAKPEMLAVLLDAKPDVKIPCNITGFTPLHLVACRDCPEEEMIRLAARLIDLGAEVNARSVLPDYRLGGLWEDALKQANASDQRTPVQVAIANDKLKLAGFLVSRGADTKDPRCWIAALQRDASDSSNNDAITVARIDFLLKHGADPLATPMVLPGDGDTKATTLVPDNPLRMCGDRCASAKRLLDAGAKPGIFLKEILSKLGPNDKDGSLVRALLKDAPLPKDAKEIPSVTSWPVPARQVIIDTLFLPMLMARPGVTIWWDDPQTSMMVIMAENHRPEFAAVLEANCPRVLQTPTRNRGSECRWPEIHLIRKVDGIINRERMEIATDSPLPSLQPGDVIALAHPGPSSQNSDEDRIMEAKFRWYLNRDVVVPVVFEIDGKSRKITMRGDQLGFDPRGDTVPLLPAGPLARVLGAVLDPAGQVDDLGEASIRIERAGWDAISFSMDDRAVNRFALQADDKVIVQRAPAEKRMVTSYLKDGKRFPRDRVAITVPGLPWTRVIDGTAVDGSGAYFLPMTLVQVITDSYAPRHTLGWNYPKDDNDATLAAKIYNGLRENLPKGNLDYLTSVPEHPDFAAIRIRRLAADGTESVLKVDLEKAIKACGDQTPAAIARAADVELQAGDIIELPVKNPPPPAPWTGFDPAQLRFFQKVLAAQYTERKDEEIIRKSLDYQQPRWRNWPGGLVAVHPATGSASARWDGQGMERGGKKFGRNADAVWFLRDGDKVGGHYYPVNQFPVPGRQPRPRVVPPPPTPAAQPQGPQYAPAPGVTP